MGGQPLPDDYFRQPPFAGAKPGELFARHTCSGCEMFFFAYAEFRAHVPECYGDPGRTGAFPPGSERTAAHTDRPDRVVPDPYPFRVGVGLPGRMR